VLRQRCLRVLVGAGLMIGVDAGMAQSSEESLLVDGLIRYLGVEPDQRQAVLAGETVVAGLPGIESREEEIAAGGAFMLIAGVSARDLVDAFLETGSFEQMHDMTRVDLVTLNGLEDSLENEFDAFELDLEDAPHDVIRAPAEHINLAPEEILQIASIDPGAPDVELLLTAAMRRVLSQRLSAYASRGLEADRVYIRDSGDAVSPTEQLRSALSRMSVIRGPFDPFVAAIMTPVAAGTDASRMHRLHWVEKIADDRRVVALADRVVYFDDQSALAAEIHYYVSGTYDALLTVVGATPVQGQTLLFAISHTFTDRVAGVGSSLRHRVARRMVSEGLAAHLERVREHVAANH
jgi:hypothetical protein